MTDGRDVTAQDPTPEQAALSRAPAGLSRAMPRLILALAALLAVVGGYYALDRWVWRPPLPEGLIQANGRMEGDRITIASKFPGRVAELLAREGDRVTAGQVVVRLDDAQTRARVAQARLALAALEHQTEAAHQEYAVLNLEVPLAIEAAQAQVDQAATMVARALSVEKEASNDVERYRRLAANDNASRQQLDQAELKWEVAHNEVNTARAALTQARKQLAQAELGWRRIRTKENEVAALERQRDQAEAALAEVESVLADLTIVAPTNGTITTRLADVGEVVSAGAPLLELVDLDRLYLQVYVSQALIGKLRLDLPARIYTDAFPDRPFEGRVRYIASRAEFTPKEVQTPDERVKLIYAVRIYLTENPQHRLTPGLPADAVIRWKDEAPWAKPRW